MPPPKIPSILSPLLLFTDTVCVGAPPPLMWITPRAPTAFLSRLSDSDPFLCCKVTFCTRNSEWRPLQNLTTACRAGELGTALRITFPHGCCHPTWRTPTVQKCQELCPSAQHPSLRTGLSLFSAGHNSAHPAGPGQLSMVFPGSPSIN